MASSGAAPEVLTYAEARRRVLSAASLLPGERVPLGAALGRALRGPVRAPHPLPPFTNSSMDGFAVRAADLAAAAPESPVELPVAEVLAAGRVATAPLAPGRAARIMTGAPLPEGADAVVPFEDCERLERDGAEWARFPRPAAPRANVREAGADLAAGQEALAAGRELSAHDLALLAALGVAAVEVGARPRVAIVSTGDELLDVSEPLRPGAIRDSNLPLLEALVAGAGGAVASATRAPDRPEAVEAAVREALPGADLVLTIGGVSAGDFDPVKAALAGLGGGIALWRVAMKPGRPQAFGAAGGRLVHGLPGNPASVACVFEALTRPLLRRLQGFAEIDRPRLEVRAAEDFESRAGRTDFARVTLEPRAGTLWARAAGEPVSGHLAPQSRAHALLVIPAERPSLAAGEAAEALLLRWPPATAP